MELGKSPLQKSFKNISNRMEKIEKNISTLLELEKEELLFIKKKEKQEKDRERKKKQNEKRFSLGLKKVLNGMKQKAEKKVKSFLDTLKDLLIKGIILTIVGTIISNWKAIEEWWNDTRQKIEDIITSFNEGVNDISTWLGGGTVLGEKNPVENQTDLNNMLRDFLAKKFGKDVNLLSGGPEIRKEGEIYVVKFSDGTEFKVDKIDPDYENLTTINKLLEQGTGFNIFGLDTRSTIQKFTDLQRSKTDIEKKLNETSDSSEKEKLNKELQDTVKQINDVKKKIKDQKLKLSESAKTQMNLPPELSELFETAPEKQTGGIMTPGGGSVFGKIKTGDTVPALLEHGEYVLNRRAVDHIGRRNLDAINFGSAPRFQNGGWISGPMSGYPVSLDGGKSIAFEGHGTEWVGFKRSAGGITPSSAFVVPFNTPRTKIQSNLTEMRMNEAKSRGFNLPKFASGGTVKNDEKRGTPGMGEPDLSVYERIEQKRKEKKKESPLKSFAAGGLLSTNGSQSDLKLSPATPFAEYRKHHNKDDSDPYNNNRLGGLPIVPRDYVVVRDFDDKSKDRGSPVVAGVDGKVTHASGYTVVISKNGRDRAQFHHFDSILAREGQTVTPSTVIGKQGNKPGGAVHVHLDAHPSDHRSWVANQLGATFDPSSMSEAGETGSETGTDSSMMGSFTSAISGIIPGGSKFIEGFVKGFQESFGSGQSSSSGELNTNLYSSGSVGTATGPMGDRIPAILENGEYVLNKNAVNLIGKENLDGINFGIASRFGDRGPSTQLMKQIGKSNYIGSSSGPIVVNAPSVSKSVPNTTVAQANDKLLPSLPSVPPGNIMNALAFRPIGTVYTPYV